jgi:hypothetical protein
VDARFPLFALLVGCGPGEAGDSGVGGDEVGLVAEGLDEAVLAVRGTDVDDVWACGSDTGHGPLLLHFDGQAWARVDTGLHGNLWALWPVDGGVVAVGDDGAIVFADATSGTAQGVQETPGISFLGVWGASDDDLWVVGGDLTRTIDPLIWRLEDGAWTAYADETTKRFGHKSYYTAVGGASADDFWVTGTGEILIHFDGDHFTSTDRGAKNDINDIDSGAGFTVAVGGLQSAWVLHYEDGDWVDHSPLFTANLASVAGSTDQLVAVGGRGTRGWWDGADWVGDAAPLALVDLTSVWLDPEGGMWIGGGQLASTPESDGVLIYDGSRSIPSP